MRPGENNSGRASPPGNRPRAPKPGASGRGLHPPLLILILAMVSPAVRPVPLSGQGFSRDRISIEPRIGVAIPTGDFGNIDPACPTGSSGCPFPIQVGTETGWGWAIRTQYALNPLWSLFGEYGKANLNCSVTFCGTRVSPGTKGLSLGLRAMALPLGNMDIWVEGAGVFEEVTIIRSEDREGNREPAAVAYPWSLGISGGVGAELPLTGENNFFFSPGFRFRYVPADPPDDHTDLTSVIATYMLFEVGFRVELKG